MKEIQERSGTNGSSSHSTLYPVIRQKSDSQYDENNSEDRQKTI
jgi:hypothetical protein